ncbi:hypothetical protein PSTT_07443 [Puccinia striiformis]|uniref:OTU domain-containing protein n=1 Tax=Puccinia striiformis TaxID=27350 RepID=A0A2S4VG86_9BASI|nr:hypothetical protein PSTT_07443 [Puccinia striiformis]
MAHLITLLTFQMACVMGMGGPDWLRPELADQNDKTQYSESRFCKVNDFVEDAHGGLLEWHPASTPARHVRRGVVSNDHSGLGNSAGHAPLEVTSVPGFSHEPKVPINVETLRILEAIKITTQSPILTPATIKPIKSLPGYSRTQNYIKGDGNCLFRTFAYFRYADQDEHIRVRKEMVEYMKLHPLEFQDFVEGEDSDPKIRLKKYLDKMKNIGAWGDQLSIKALSELYHFNVVVLSITDLSVYPQLHVVEERSRDFMGVYLKDEHYELLFQVVSHEKRGKTVNDEMDPSYPSQSVPTDSIHITQLN